MTDQVIVEIPLDQLHESPFNPRRTFLDLEDLAANIKAEGRIHQPLKVRPAEPRGPQHLDRYEIVFGHRRFRAAPLAGLITVPCIVEPMNDAMARSAQIAENLQRKDVHPIEEAEGFQAMLQDDGISADELAALVGKSRSHVYSRLKLLQACPQIRDACLAGEIGSEVALLIARLRSDKLQQKALGYIRGKYIDLGDGGAKSYRAIRSLLNERFALQLAGALFNPTDAGLVQEAGSCTGCMKRSGNAPEFQDLVAEGAEGDVDVDAMDDEQYAAHLQRIQTSYRSRNSGARFSGPDICTDPDCFAAKKKAHLAQEAARLRAEGKVVVDGGKAMQAVSATGDVKGAYVALADVRAELKKVKGDKPATVLIQDPRGGKLFEAVKREDLQAAGITKAEPKKKKGGDYDHEAARREDEKRQREIDTKTAANKRLLAAVRGAAAQRPRTADELRLVLGHLICELDNGDDGPVLYETHGVAGCNALLERLPTLTRDELGLLLLDVVIVRDVKASYWNHRGMPEQLASLATLYGIDAQAASAEPVQTPEPASIASTPLTAARARGKAARTSGVMYACAATGQTWSGRGLQPAWVKARLAAGATLADLQAQPPAAKAAKKTGPAAQKVKDDAGDAGDAGRDPRVADMFEETDA